MTTYKVLLEMMRKKSEMQLNKELSWNELGFEVIGSTEWCKSYGNSRKTAARCGHYRYQNAIYEWFGTGT